MKFTLTALVLVMSLGAFAQSDAQYQTTNVIMSPFELASKLIESVRDLVSSKNDVSKSLQGRGVAGKEQIRDELVELNKAMIAGQVTTIEQVEQPTLKELFREIEASEAQMNEVNSIVISGSKLQRIATMVTVQLMLQ